MLSKTLGLLVPTLVWFAGFMLRPLLIRTECAQVPTPCIKDSVNAIDRIAFLYGSITADFYSNVVQNAVIVGTFILPWLMLLWAKRQGAALSPQTLPQNWTKKYAANLNLQVLTLTATNGAIIEWCRNLVQRPRPLVFNSPLTDGLNPHAYTSFYSGHTSFVALGTTFWIFYFLRTGKFCATRIAIATAVIAIPLTGALRVIGGRHYPTDVLMGAFMGVVLAAIQSRYLKQKKTR